MAAPSSVYRDLKLVDTTTVDDRELYVAAYLQNTTPTSGSEWGTGYFNASDIPVGSDDRTTANEKIKSIFKLDAIYPVASGSTTTGAGFIGGISCDAAGNLIGTNAQYHSGSRYSGLIYQSGSAAWYRLLNDGGLNRRSSSSIATNDNTQVWWANYISVSASVWAPFYQGSDTIGIESKLGVTGSWAQIYTEPFEVPRKGFKSYSKRGIDSLGELGNSIQLRTFTINEEGKSYGENILSGTLADRIWQFESRFLGEDAYASPGMPTQIFMTETSWQGLANLNTSTQVTDYYGYNSDLLVNHVPNGYYWFAGPTKSGVYRYDGYFSQLVFESSQPGDPGGGVPSASPVLYTMVLGGLVDGLFFTGISTDVPSGTNRIQLDGSLGQTQVAGNFNITGAVDPGHLDPVQSRYADIWLIRVNRDTPSLDEEVYIDTILIAPGTTSHYFSGTLTKGGIAYYDEFRFIEKL